MLLLKLLEESDSEVVYSYFPEKKKYFGTVKINKITGETVSYTHLIEKCLKPQKNQLFSKISGTFLIVDLTGIEPVSKHQSPVLLRVSFILRHSLRPPGTNNRMLSVCLL